MNADVVVDAGNSFIKWGRCSDAAVVEVVSLGPADHEEWISQLANWGLKKNCQWVVTGSDPSRRDRMAKWLDKQYEQVRTLNSFSQLSINIHVKQPDKVGLDRLCNAVAVNSRKPPSMAAIVIDAGTAVTVDYVDEAGAFQGGAILPGLKIMAELLSIHTAALPLIKPGELKQLTGSATPPGKSTEEAMALGIGAGLLGGVERIARAYVEMANKLAVIYIGGGDGAFVHEKINLGECHLWPEMTLEGIRLAAERWPA